MSALSTRDGHRLLSPTPSLATAYLELDAAELRFCDDVVAAIAPASANDFPSLRAAYEQQVLVSSARAAKGKGRATHLTLPATSINYHRAWETLVRLAKVRGTSWQQRWQTLRMALRVEDDGSSSEYDEDEEAAHLHSTETDRRSIAGPEAHLTSPSEHVAERRKKVSRQEIEALQSRMAALTAEASSLAGSLQDNRRTGEDGSPPRLLSRRGGSARQSESRPLPLAFRRELKPTNKATTVESASDEDVPTQSRRAERIPGYIDARKDWQFAEVVARSRQEREALAFERETAVEAAQARRMQHLAAVADHKYAGDLQRKCLSWWITSARRQHELSTRAMTFRRSGLRGKAWHAWQEAAQKRQLSCQSANVVDVVRCKLRAWRTWQRRRGDIIHNRREERRMELRGAFEVTRSRLEHRIVYETFSRWKHRHLDYLVHRFRRTHLLATAFTFWKMLTFREADLNAGVRQFQCQQQHHTLAKVWAQWCNCRRQRQHEAQEIRQADAWRKKNLQQATLRAWITRLLQVDQLRDRAQEIWLGKEARIAAHAWKAWRLSAIERHFTRVLDTSRTSVALQLWREQTASVLARRQAAERNLVKLRTVNTLRSALHRWSDLTRQSRIACAMASARRKRLMMEDALLKWQKSLSERKEQFKVAQAFHEDSLKQRILYKWKDCLLESRLDAFQTHRSNKTTAAVMSFWRARHKERQRESLAVATTRSKIERRMRGQVLQTWMKSVIDRKSLFMEAAESRDAKLVSLAWTKWVQACIRHEDLLKLCKSHLDVKRDVKLKKVFSFWLHTALARRSLRVRAGQWEVQQAQKLRIESFSRWHDRTIEERLRSLELDALMARQAATKEAYFITWRNLTESLPAIKLDHARLRSHAFYHWKELVPHARMRHAADNFDRSGLISKAFDHWMRIAKAKKALRAASRFGNPSAIRLRAAHRRSSGSTTGGAFGRARKLSQRRSRSSTPGLAVASYEEGDDVHAPRDADLSSLRASDFGSATERSPSTRWAVSVAQIQDNSPSIVRKTRSEDILEVAGQNLSPPPALRRWIMGVSQSLPPSSTAVRGQILETPTKGLRAQPDLAAMISDRSSEHQPRMRTPSPTASHTQSEVTVRIRNSPRKTSRGNRAATQVPTPIEGQLPVMTPSEGYQQALLALRERRRRQSMEADRDR